MVGIQKSGGLFAAHFYPSLLAKAAKLNSQ